MSTLTYPELVCIDDLDPLGAETTSDLQNFEQDIYHRLSQGWGSNADDPDAGAGLVALCSGSPTTGYVQNKVATEVRKDPRANSITAQVTKTVINALPAFAISTVVETDADTLETAITASATGTSLTSGSAT